MLDSSREIRNSNGSLLFRVSYDNGIWFIETKKREILTSLILFKDGDMIVNDFNGNDNNKSIIPKNIPISPKAKTLYVDFPWAKSQEGRLGAIEKYDLMSMDRILKFPLKDLAADNCTLWLWTTNACLPEALKVIEENGFVYRGYYVWCKTKLGLGAFYLRQCRRFIQSLRPIRFGRIAHLPLPKGG